MTVDTSTRGQEWPSDWMPAFLLGLRGRANVREACEAAGISRTIAYRARTQSVRFRNAWDEAIEDALDTLEAEAWNRAKTISDYLLWRLLASYRREKFGDAVAIKVDYEREAERIAQEYGLPPDKAARIISLAERLKQARTG